MLKVVPTFKISFLGNEDVGKSTLSINYLKPVFKLETKQTLGCEWFLKELIITGLKINFQCFIIPVKEQFKSLISTYILGSQLIVVMYDITDFITNIFITWYMGLLKIQRLTPPTYRCVPVFPNEFSFSCYSST